MAPSTSAARSAGRPERGTDVPPGVWGLVGSAGDSGPSDERPVDGEQEQDRDEVGDVADQLQRGRRGPVAEETPQHAADRTLVRKDAVEIERDAGVGDQPALSELRDGEGNQPGSDEDEHGARDGEEASEVDAHARREDRPADRDRDRKAEDAAENDIDARAVERQDGDQEQDRLDTFADHRDERQTDEGAGT